MRIVMVCFALALGAMCRADDVANVGAFEFDHLPHQGTPGWNLDNLEYPSEAITIERISSKNRGLRIGRPDGSQSGRYTITLRASTHDWDPTAVGVTHSTNVKLAADYRGTVQVAISIPGAGALLDLGNGKCVLWQRVGETDERVDETPLVRKRIPDWLASDLHDYRLEWAPGTKPRDLACRLLIDGQLIKEFHGHSRPSPLDSTLEISFENGSGTGLIDQVSWNINGGVPKPNLEFTVEGGTRQLFLDDFGVQEVAGLTRKMHSPDRHAGNPVLRGEFPWEKTSTSVYGTMLYDEARKRFRLWYLCSPEPPASGRKWLEVGGYRRVTGCTLLAYAESDDAVHWEKPILNQLSFEGSKRNNLIDIGIDNPEGVGVLHDVADPDPERRFKAFFWDRRLTPPDDPTGVEGTLREVPLDPPDLNDARRAGGMWVAFSSDGVRWKTVGPVLPHGSDTTHTILFDPRRKKYLGFGRMGFGRTVALSESDDALSWTEPRRVLSCDEQDGPGGQIYGMPTDLYEGMYLGMFWMYREGTDAKIDTQLALSRDGRRWRRVADRQTFLANGPEGAWDDGMSRAGRGICVVGETIYLHYSMVNGPHRSARFPKVDRKFPGAIGLVTLRRDGFVSYEASESEGRLTTKPFSFPAGRLHVNCDARAGEVSVDLVNSRGNTLASSGSLTGDHNRWDTGMRHVPTPPEDNSPVHLVFKLKNARLYSYWFE